MNESELQLMLMKARESDQAMMELYGKPVILSEDTYDRIADVVLGEHSGLQPYQLEYVRRIQMGTRCVGKLGISAADAARNLTSALRLLNTHVTYRRTRSKQPRTVRVISRRT